MAAAKHELKTDGFVIRIIVTMIVMIIIILRDHYCSRG